MRRRGLLLGTVACATLLVSACGEGAGSSADTIKIGVISQETGPGVPSPEVRAGAEAAAASINAAGGIDGKKIDVVACDTKSIAEGSADCWRRFAMDKDIVAVTGVDFLDEASADVISTAKLPVVGFYANTDFDMTSKYSFPADGGLATQFRGAALYAARHGAKSVGLIRFDLPQAGPIEDQVRATLKENGSALTSVQTISPTALDFSPSAASLVDADVDAVVVSVSGNQNPLVLKALKQQGYSGLVVINGFRSDDAELKSFGVDTKGLVGVNLLAPTVTDITNPTINQFRTDMRDYQSDKQQSGYAAQSWLGVNMVADVAKDQSGEVTRESILRGMEHLKDYGSGELAPALDFTHKGQVPDAPRIVNPYVSFMVSNGEQWTWDGTLVDAINGSKISVATAK